MYAPSTADTDSDKLVRTDTSADGRWTQTKGGASFGNRASLNQRHDGVHHMEIAGSRQAVMPVGDYYS